MVSSAKEKSERRKESRAILARTYGPQRARGNLAEDPWRYNLRYCLRVCNLLETFGDPVGESASWHFGRVLGRRYLSHWRRRQFFDPSHVDRPPFFLFTLQFTVTPCIDLCRRNEPLLPRLFLLGFYSVSTV